MIGRKKPEGLTRKQYDDALGSFVKGAIEIMAAGRVKESINMAKNIPDLCWELGRPGVIWDETDLTDRLDDQGRKYIERLVYVIVVGDDGKPIVGFGRVYHHDGSVKTDSENLPHHIGQQVSDIFTARENDSGYDMSDISSIQSIIDKSMTNTIDKQVEEFGKELDDLNKLWSGGGD